MPQGALKGRGWFFDNLGSEMGDVAARAPRDVR